VKVAVILAKVAVIRVNVAVIFFSKNKIFKIKGSDPYFWCQTLCVTGYLQR
jgi:hypothetical protein